MSALSSPAYAAIIERLCDPDIAPHCGYHGPKSLPELTRAELAAVLRAEPSLLVEAASDDALVGVVATYLENEKKAELFCDAGIGIALTIVLREQAAEYIYPDVCDELARIEAEESVDRRSPRQIAADDAAVPVAGPL